MAARAYQWHTIAEAFEQIGNEQDPWIALGNFLNDWWYYAVEHRRELIDTPLPLASTSHTKRWALSVLQWWNGYAGKMD